jgi:hypothetical protein
MGTEAGRWLVILVAVLVASGCDTGGDEPAAPAQSSTTTVTTAETTTTTTAVVPTTSPPAVTRTQTCQGSRYEVGYPTEWATNRGDVAPPCRYFDPEPFTIPPATEVVGLAVILDVESIPFVQLRDAAGGPNEEIVGRRDVTVDGHRGLRLEARERDGALLPVGTPSLRYLVDLDDATLVAVTYGLRDADRDRNRTVLDAMVGSLKILAKARCSAAGLAPSPVPLELPGPTAEMRRSIVAAATGCDFGRLAALATPGTFSYSFGQRGDPAAAWRTREMDGKPVLRILVELLDRPSASRPVGSQTQYVWPRAYAYERWIDVPPEARDELTPLYGPSDFENFERFGTYSGYRVGITAGGDWQFFIGGD